ncbi:major facilitator superfamily domain-containing protein [Leptodontidium sp. 2 PMI_412]|nr:major facilitator superfamily domain-containing protein [Leptodontidium sp. 2 PMI_412]
MDALNFPPPSPVSPLSETATQATTPKTSWGKPKSYISYRTSTGIPRNSFVTISSRSITVFAEIKDLPSRNGRQQSKIEGPKAFLKDEIPDLAFKRQSYDSVDNIPSFGFNMAVPEPVHGHVQASADRLIDQPGQQNLHESFPRPPSKALLSFPTVFPENSQGRQPASTEKSLPPLPYHAFDLAKKKGIVYLMAIVGVLTPLSTFIYFPALGDISRAFHLDAEFVVLTIAVHMAVQGIAPLIWMPLGDYFGRRFALVAALAVFVGANAGLLFSNSFLYLMLLRAAQAVGSADLPIIGAAVISDISTGKERGALIGIYGSILMFGHVTSPVLGGMLTQFFGFRSIFWFQLALSGLSFILVVLFLPETLRNIAGNGTIKLKPYQQPLLAIIESSPDARFNANPDTITLPLTFMSFVEPLFLLSHMDILGTIIFGAIAFATVVVVISTTALFLETYYHLSTLLVGLAFLPSAAGTLLGFFFISCFLDRDYKIIESYYKSGHNIEEDSTLSFKHNSDFPIERARLRNIWWISLLFIGATIGYGFSLSGNHIAIPLIMQFLVAFGATAILLANGVLISDLCPEDLASVTAVINLVRFCMGALAVSVVQLLFNRLDAGFVFLVFAMATLAVTPILVLQWMFGVKWRMEGKSSSEESTSLDRPRVLLMSPFNPLPSWSNIWQSIRTKSLSSKGKRIPELKILTPDVPLAIRALCSRVPCWREIWGKMRRAPTGDGGL